MGTFQARGPLGSNGTPLDLNDGTLWRGLSPVPNFTSAPARQPLRQVPATTAHHDVVRGDSWWSIAAAKLGQGTLYAELAVLNGLPAQDPLAIGTRLIVPDYQRCDLTASYMLGEMLGNAMSTPAQDIAKANQRSLQARDEGDAFLADTKQAPWYQVFRIQGDVEAFNALARQSGLAAAEAQARWFLQVHRDGPWDHKPILRRKYQAMSTPPRPFGSMDKAYHFPVRGDIQHEYYYDVWSNVHYGFVGTRCGFDATTLQQGAASGLPGAGDNDEGDVISVAIGIELWRRYGTGLTTQNLCAAIVAQAGAYRSARAREIAAGTPPDKATQVLISGNDYK